MIESAAVLQSDHRLPSIGDTQMPGSWLCDNAGAVVLSIIFVLLTVALIGSLTLLSPAVIFATGTLIPMASSTETTHSFVRDENEHRFWRADLELSPSPISEIDPDIPISIEINAKQQGKDRLYR